MPNQYSITDMHLFSVDRSEDRWLLLRDSDHLLRRFGQLELIPLMADESKEFPLNAEADEIWFILEGKVSVNLVDERERSPSQGEEVQLTLSANNPQGLLLPFGVARSFSSKESASLLRLSTHSDARHQVENLGAGEKT